MDFSFSEIFLILLGVPTPMVSPSEISAHPIVYKVSARAATLVGNISPS